MRDGGAPEWMRAMAHEPVPHIVAEGPDEGAIRYLNASEAAEAAATGSHISVAGRDMTAFDFAAEREAMRARIAEAAKRKRPARAAEPEPAAVDAAPPERPRGGARVGVYENRAMVTKPGKKD